MEVYEAAGVHCRLVNPQNLIKSTIYVDVCGKITLFCGEHVEVNVEKVSKI